MTMSTTPLPFAQSAVLANGAEAIALLIYVAIIVVLFAALWRVFEKANQPGWGVLIPIYNIILLLRIAGKPVWWLILMLIPLVNIIAGVLVPMAIAKNFGKGVGFGLGLIFLPFIFYPILGFGGAEYAPVTAPVVVAG
jgi:ABC-type sulfate transport system permease subunit